MRPGPTRSQRRIGSRRLLLVMVCNDANSGVFTGRVESIVVQNAGARAHGWEATIEPTRVDSWALQVDAQRLRLKLGRVWYPFTRMKCWWGSWCCDAFEFKRPTAVRLLGNLQDSGAWCVQEGSPHFKRWWRDGSAQPQRYSAAALARAREESLDIVKRLRVE